MSRKKKIVIAALAVVIVAAGVITAVVTTGSSGGAQPNEVVVFGKVQARTLQDTVTLSGTLARKQIRNVDAADGAS